MKKMSFKRFRLGKQLRLGSYLRELSIVIIGIGVTLYASNLVTSCNSQRNLNAQLQAIYTELGENLVKLDEHTALIERHRDFGKMIQSYTTYNQDIPKDSVMRYTNLLDIGINGILYKHTAYDLLLHSGNVLMIKDKKRLADISNCYADLEMINMVWAELVAMKRDMIISLFAVDGFADIDFNKPAWRQMRSFFATFGGGMGHISETRKEIEATLAQRPK
ncbi:MAG: hypothetical protein LBL97_01095 [Prevotellaceae bacterium]|jgi:hypothetical protein|nr:hypothetical protein [Prevotellaceae bacterium]